MTRNELINKITSVAEQIHGIREAKAIARLFADRRTELSPTDLADLAAACPIQYILGLADFYGLELSVGEGVLIPRPETEELVRWILDDVRREGPAFPTILDVGTGSGAIAIALAKNLPQARVRAVDVSPEALKYARLNDQKYASRVSFLQADILDWQLEVETFDIIVSNPPYIPELERINMHDNVKRYEPEIALFVPDDDPLLFYRAIARIARHSLTPANVNNSTGALYLEVHENFANETAALLRSEGFNQVTIRKDINDKLRMIKAKV